MISGGFAELEANGVQEELAAECLRAGMRLVGPNCVGVVNTDPDIRMNATFLRSGRYPGASARVPIRWRRYRVLSRAHELGLGVSTFVSMGNKADVSTNDLLQYWADDPATDVVLLYLESFGNPRKFAHLALTTGPPEANRRAQERPYRRRRGAPAPTPAALADPDAAVDTLLRQTGVIRVDTLEELSTSRRWSRTNRFRPADESRDSNGGGPAIVAADACVAAGLEVPELSPPLQAALRELAPTGGVQNPVDLVASAGATIFEHAAGLLLTSGEIDALLVIYVAPYVTRADDITAAVARAATRPGTSRSRACLLGLEEPPASATGGRHGARSCPRSPIRSPRCARWPTRHGSASGASSPRERFATVTVAAGHARPALPMR